MARKEVIQIRCSEIEKDTWKGVANQHNLELSAWIRLVLDKAARLSEARAAIGTPDPPDDQWQ